LENIKICIVGLGYVGLPLAVEFGKKFPTIGFDINEKRVDEIKNGVDLTNEVDENELKKILYSNQLKVTTSKESIVSSNFYIISVPTPIDIHKKPDLNPLKKACELIGSILKHNDFVVFESTVYPGLTEEFCVPILESISDLKLNCDFHVGYSPERINPGDKVNNLTNIVKVTSGSSDYSAKIIDNVYKSIIEAGTFKAASIKVAEAAKVIENSQRDINIAFVNELSKIFGLMGINTNEVLEAASTKWNFMNFKPGLVGGHCIGVDPYYLAEKSIDLGYNPEIILSGRKMNDSMGPYIVNEVLKMISEKDIQIKDAKVLILGFTFKENCPDIRNTRVIDIYNELIKINTVPSICDPIASKENVLKEYKIEIENDIPEDSKFDVVIVAVAHNVFKKISINRFLKPKNIIFDVKEVFGKGNFDRSL
jgi:UDP-N-acetyl-D-glucosamine/UDP-N-acetyl-D-galactosamine dehydrogenase